MADAKQTRITLKLTAMTIPNENGQGGIPLQDLFFEAMQIAGAAIALAEDYSGGESETAQYLSKEYDKLNLKFDKAIDKRNAMHNAIVYSKLNKDQDKENAPNVQNKNHGNHN